MGEEPLYLLHGRNEAKEDESLTHRDTKWAGIQWSTVHIRRYLLQGRNEGKENEYRSSCGKVTRFSHLLQEGHPGVEIKANLQPISHRCRLEEVAFVWELTKKYIHLPLGCLQGG